MTPSPSITIPAAAAASDRGLASIPLSSIKRVSGFNPRHGNVEGAESMAASILANGQLQPMLVVAEKGIPGFAILDGQLRWRAMLLLVEQGHLTPDHQVAAGILYFEEPQLREIALAVNIIRRGLHPVEEYRAFDALVRAGLDEMRIACNFGLSLRHVRQRLALGRLAPKILDVWFKGLIDADAAKAFTAVENHAAQESAFDELVGGRTVNPAAVRKLLLSGSMPVDCREALYVGAEAYTAAGGAINEDLFSDSSDFLDGPLLKKLAKEKLNADCSVIAAAEGWGFFETGGVLRDHEIAVLHPDVLDVELARLEEIGNSLLTGELEDERYAIELRGCLRGTPQTSRAGLGIFAQLDFHGRPLFTRGLLPQPAKNNQDSAPSVASSRRVKKGAAATPSLAAAPALKDLNKTTREILNEAVNKAFFLSIVNRPDIAIMIAVAALGCDPGLDVHIDLRGDLRVRSAKLLQQISKMNFQQAISICKNAPLADLSVCFSEIIGLVDWTGMIPLAGLCPFAAALAARGVALDMRLARAFNYEKYFTAATKKARQDIAVEIDPALSKVIGKKPNSFSVETLSRIAADHAWLPEPLSIWAKMTWKMPDREAPMEEESLAAAMDEAFTGAAAHHEETPDAVSKEAAAPAAKKQRPARKRK